ncbi:hypothetical protein M758_6G098400 [Ceratodon purpureus]|nr:hypothetical protein M758_6G098400 [Ceratodon purpureus]
MMRSVYRRNIFHSKAERPLLLLFPSRDDAASVMRIRKGQARGGNASARGESNSSFALAAASGSQDQFETTDDFLPVGAGSHSIPAEKHCENIPDSQLVVRSEAPPSWISALQTNAKRSLSPPDRPYMNLDEFVNSLASKNCFPEEEFSNPYSDQRHKTGESSGLINFSGPSEHQRTPHFLRVDSGNSIKKNADDVDTSLRLAISPRETAQAADPLHSVKGGSSNIVNNTQVMAGTLDVDGLQQYRTAAVSEARTGSTAMDAGKTIIAHTEAYGQSYHTAQTTSILESTEVGVGAEVEVEAGQLDQTMKSSTESMERRPRRASRTTGRKRGRLPSPAASNEEQTDNDDQEEEESSDYSSQRTKTRKRKRKRSHISVSSSTLATQDSEKRKQKPGLGGSGASKSASKRTKTRKGSNSRSGRPKKLKYMKQENTEELGNQCNRSDGKGWTCPLLAKTGYQLCDHHLDKLRCKPGSRSKYNKKKKGAPTLS